MALHARVLRSTTEVRDLVPAWDALCRRSANELSTHPLWMLLWWDVFGRHDLRRLRILSIFDGGELVGLAPIQQRPALYRRVLPLRRLELLGTGEDEADEICSDYNGVIAAPGYEATVVDAFVRHLVDAGRWEQLTLQGIDRDATWVAPLERALTRAGLPFERRELSISPYVALPARFDDYVEQLPPSRRKFVRKCLRDFDKWAPERTFAVVKNAHELVEGQRILETLHGTRWADAGAQGVFASSKFATFHRRLMHELLDRDALQLGWLAVGDRPLAIVYNFLWKGRVHSYQSGRALDLPNTIRVGILSHLYAMQDAIARGMNEYDFLAGRQRYKLELSLHSRTLETIEVWRHPLVRGAESLVDRAIRVARQTRDRLRGLEPRVNDQHADDRNG